MAAKRFEEILREEARRALGADRLSLGELMQAIEDFPKTAPPEETAVFAEFIRVVATGMEAPARSAVTPEAATSAVSEAVAALDAFRAQKAAGSHGAPAAPKDSAPDGGPAVPPRRPAAATSRVIYPAPRAAPSPAPEPSLADGLEPDDIDDFTAAGS